MINNSDIDIVFLACHGGLITKGKKAKNIPIPDNINIYTYGTSGCIYIYHDIDDDMVNSDLFENERSKKTGMAAFQSASLHGVFDKEIQSNNYAVAPDDENGLYKKIMLLPFYHSSFPNMVFRQFTQEEINQTGNIYLPRVGNIGIGGLYYYDGIQKQIISQGPIPQG